MLKNMILSMLGAAAVMRYVPWSEPLTRGESIGVYVGFSTILIIFCFFSDFLAEKWREKRERQRRIREIMAVLREVRLDAEHDRSKHQKADRAC